MAPRAMMALSTKKKKKKQGRKRKEKPSFDSGDFEERHRLMRAEFDSHADTCTFSKGECLILGESGDSVQVGGWSPKLGALNESLLWIWLLHMIVLRLGKQLSWCFISV